MCGELPVIGLVSTLIRIISPITHAARNVYSAVSVRYVQRMQLRSAIKMVVKGDGRARVRFFVVIATQKKAVVATLGRS